MRLINVDSHEVEEFYGSNIPQYAILSHTWGVEEASFREWAQRLTRLRKMRRPGFSKVHETCKQARRHDLRYVWVDTVCIDKSSSAELSEAINSMFNYYARAAVCFVYLEDVSDRPRGGIDKLDLVPRSRWFTRGWTLQELIAPANVVFYTNEWSVLGTKNYLAVLIAGVTGIEDLCLQKKKRVDEYTIAQRMSWAANRVTTREEDIAYCLLGIFGINMPLLYGEGIKAFRRLQEEIIKVSDDHSIFAFDIELSDATLFAHHPSAFAKRNRVHANFPGKLSAPFTMTNAGLSMSTPLIRTLSPYWVLAPLNCVEVDAKDRMRRSQICLPLFGKDNTFMRGRTPVTLINKKLDDSGPGMTNQIRDLTTRKESSYLISYFTRVYPIYGNELDEAIKGFEVDELDQREQGFLLTFPRGMGNYQLCAAFPPEDLRRDISFFIPTTGPDPGTDSLSEVDESVVRGIIIFRDESVHPPKYVAIYLAVEARPGGNWTCTILPQKEPQDIDLSEIEVHLDKADQAELYNSHTHYDQTADALVAARTQFPTANGDPCREAILVEIVFDVDVLMEEQDLE
ncbi:Heterokaryon incompatibility domain-containing protein [Madurella fahalii]|uniref:Heterokaryon incompatibility domain-containing protein n=1 Tax=Madurella fahalii TaxID=1157608 RepID=A0ABQ0GL65_9PEZI